MKVPTRLMERARSSLTWSLAAQMGDLQPWSNGMPTSGGRIISSPTGDAANSRSRHYDIDTQGRLLADCWCGESTFLVSAELLADCMTVTCGQPGCAPTVSDWSEGVTEAVTVIRLHRTRPTGDRCMAVIRAPRRVPTYCGHRSLRCDIHGRPICGVHRHGHPDIPWLGATGSYPTGTQGAWRFDRGNPR